MKDTKDKRDKDKVKEFREKVVEMEDRQRRPDICIQSLWRKQNSGREPIAETINYEIFLATK